MKLERRITIESIGSVMDNICKGTNYKLTHCGELPFDEKWNKVQYNTKLKNGSLVITLMGKNGIFQHRFDDVYPFSKTTEDYEEILVATKHFDSNINSDEMIKMFNNL